MPEHQLHLITDRKQTRGDLLTAVTAALHGGVDCVQVREKTAPARTLLDQAERLLPEAHHHGAALLINDRVDVALAVGADGVHLAGMSLPPQVVRPILDHRVLGVSVHSLPDALAAVAGGADYVTFGHVFPTTSHPGQPPRGLQELQRIVEAVPVPVIAIGGITAENVDSVLATGCAGIAVISAILGSETPELAARTLRVAMDQSPVKPRHRLALASLTIKE